MAGQSLEDLEEFIKKTEKAHELVTLLQSGDTDVVKKTQNEIDTILANDWEEEEVEGYKTKDGFSKSSINKIDEKQAQPGNVPGGYENIPSDQAGFMKMVEDDANKRAENRRRKEEKSKKRRGAGNELFKKGKYVEAIQEYDIAIKLTGWNVSLFTNKAQCYIKLKDFDKAIEACDRAIYIEDDFTKAYIQKSNALIAQKHHKEAVECLDECLLKIKNDKSVVNKYLHKAKKLLDVANDNDEVIKSVSPENQKEFQHFLSKFNSKKVFEATIASELLLKSIQQSTTNTRLFRALGGLEIIGNQLSKHTEHTLHVNLFNILKSVIETDPLSFHHWLYCEPTASLTVHSNKDQYRMLVLLLMQKIVFSECEEIVESFLEYFSNDLMKKIFLVCFDEKSTKAMTVLILGRAIRNPSFLSRFKSEAVMLLKSISDYIPRLVEDDIAEQKTWIGGISGLSMSPISRKYLDKSFWTIFHPLLDFLIKQDKDSMIDDILAAGMNFTLESTNVVDHGVEISSQLVNLCADLRFKKAPLLLNRVLEKCPNTLLAEDKGQFSSLLKVIRSQKDINSESLSTAIKLLARTSAVSVQARKWVVKYNILDSMLEMLADHTITNTSSKEATAVLSNAALCCAHCFQDEAVCKKMEVNVVDTMITHAKADKGLAIQQNAAITLARLATNNPVLLQRLRDLRGLEILHSRFSLPEAKS